MRFFVAFPIFVLLTSLVFISKDTIRAETVFIHHSSDPVSSTWRTISTSRTIAPTTMIVERPVVVSESIPMRLCPPINQTVLSYDLPVSQTIATGTVTTVSAPQPEMTSFPIGQQDEYRLLPPRPLSESTTAPPLVDGDLKPLLPRRVMQREIVDNESPSTEDLSLKIVAGSDAAKMENASADLIVNLTTDHNVSSEPLVKDEGVENPFKDIMLPKDLAVRTTVSKPTRSLSKPESSTTIPTAKHETPSVPPAPLHLGQSGYRNPTEEALAEPPGYPEGPVDMNEIDPKLVDPAVIIPPPIDLIDGVSHKNPMKPAPSKTVAGKDQWVSGALLLTTIIATMVACYAIILAFEFRQRWMQTVTEQNNRFSMPFDGGTLSGSVYLDDLDAYGGSSLYGSSSEGAGLGRYGLEMMEPSMRY